MSENVWLIRKFDFTHNQKMSVDLAYLEKLFAGLLAGLVDSLVLHSNQAPLGALRLDIPPRATA